MNEGSRPEAVVLCFEPRHLLGDGIHDEIFAHYNMQLRDIFLVSGSRRPQPHRNVRALLCERE